MGRRNPTGAIGIIYLALVLTALGGIHAAELEAVVYAVIAMGGHLKR